MADERRFLPYPARTTDRLTWDVRKARANLARHGITFAEAWSALGDPSIRAWPDSAHSDAEDRLIVLGMDLHGRLLFIVTKELPDGTIRLIPARRATKREEHAYTTGLL
jgi:uncharacterized DUF497 family protein